MATLTLSVEEKIKDRVRSLWKRTGIRKILKDLRISKVHQIFGFKFY